MRTAIAIALGIVVGYIAADVKAEQYMPWDRVGIDTHADLSVAVPVPYQDTATNYRIWSMADGLRWGWIEAEPSGDFRQWDSRDGWRFGRIEVER